MPLTPVDRKVALLRAQITQADIARQTDYSQAYVYDVMRGAKRNERIERAIADAIALPLADVFPPPEPSRRTPAAGTPAVA